MSTDPFAPGAMTDYRTLEKGRTTLGQWDLMIQSGPRAGQYLSPVVTIRKIELYTPPEHLRNRSKGNELLLTIQGANGVMQKKWIVRPTVKRQIAEATGSYCVQKWVGKRIQIYVDESVRMGPTVTGGLRARKAPGDQPLTDDKLSSDVDAEKMAVIEAAAKEAHHE